MASTDQIKEDVTVSPKSENVSQNETLSGKAAYEARRTEKLRQKENTQKIETVQNRKWGAPRIILWLIITAAAVYGIVTLGKGAVPKGENLSVAVPDMGRSHIEIGAAHDLYNSNPPTSGPHYVETARTGFREEEIADEHLVHNLEHGDIWIAYKPGIPEEIKDALQKFAGSKVVIAPRAANETDIALVAWNRLDKFNIDDGKFTDALGQRIRDFIKRYKNRGPEKVMAQPKSGV